LEDGKDMSIWDVFSSIPGKIASNQNAMLPAIFYHHYMQDIILMHYLNIKIFVFQFRGQGFYREESAGLTKRAWTFMTG
jgi:beta-glucosidase/6-phospho-beta-glucosidase/beta-galactosidase